ncbi:hypothetical protein H0H87_008252 [Tephrocybe sp. NHM501043]|nr:hypothetical protein H0H87_008252 [Tephrocybe sp. NHM501043]
MYALGLFTLAAAVCTVAAKTIVITVGGNTTNDATTVFKPNVVVANEGDTVLFNCELLSYRFFDHCLDPLFPPVTNGNHTVTQSTFAFPCVPAHTTDSTVNGFDSSFRDAGNEQAITTLSVTVDDPDKTIWFYDYNTCAQGGVGAVNLNKTSTETLDGFQVCYTI